MRQIALIDGTPSDGDRQQWATPRALFDALHGEYRFTVDAAALEWNKKLDRYWSPAQNGLLQDWSAERVWCNPPYDDISPWVGAASYAEIACLLLPARTDQRWFHRAASTGEVHFLLGRLSFVPPPGVVSSSNEFASILLVMGREAKPGLIASRHARDGRRIW